MAVVFVRLEVLALFVSMTYHNDLTVECCTLCWCGCRDVVLFALIVIFRWCQFSLVGHVVFSIVLENVIVVVATNIVGQPGL